MPIHVINWKRTMSLLMQDKCHVVDQNYIQYNFKSWLDASLKIEQSPTQHIIHTVNNRIAVPQVVILTQFDRLPKNQVKFSRESLFVRDGYRCGYCGQTFTKKELTVDHINPKSFGGPKSWQNTISACKPCNHFKADRTPEEAGMRLLFEPKKPSWFLHMNQMTAHIDMKPQWKPFLDSFLVREKTNDDDDE